MAGWHSGLAPYTVAKHGIIGLTQTAALEFACQGIRVNAVAPRLCPDPANECTS